MPSRELGSKLGLDYSRHHADMILRPGPVFVYCWPLILCGYVLYALSLLGMMPSPEAAGAIYYTIAVIVMVTMGVDVGLGPVAFLLLICLLAVLNVPILGHFLSSFLYHGGAIDVSFVLQLSNALLIVYMMVSVDRLFNFYRVTDASIMQVRFGHSEIATTRAGKQLRAEYPSILKALVGFGAGDLVVRDTNGDRVLLRICDVPLLFFRFRSIERRLKTYMVTEEEEDMSDI